ncbi:hypothetical protein SAMN05421747_1292 [Parapedobacter composti]|uniref:Uncharacterized protein n=1 Tax=Parapedobacter composti TaxID=623281 RepID=A0A1I1M4P8_9SPHI|nr:hypothetical protein [Parapedobacter composti]SFC80334.1 hypothetical protein SAMN05421747_1292 [Parapedobacter composti]
MIYVGGSQHLYKQVKKLLLEAWNKHQWIYDKLEDKWYTPEEFKAQWKLLVTDYNLRRYETREPYLGWKESLERIDRQLKAADDFRRKIEAYYKMDLKRK